MARYIVQRVLSTIPTMLIIIVIGFVIMELPPGDYLTYYVSQLEAQGHEGAREEAGELPRELHRAAGRLGLIGVSFPEHAGGGGGGQREAVTVGATSWTCCARTMCRPPGPRE